MNFIPHRLKEARESKGLKMTDLANLVGVTRQAISAFEKGLNSPSLETVFRLSTVLSIPREFFTNNNDSKISISSPVFFRSQQTALKKERQMSRVKLKWLIETFDVISEYLDLPSVDLPDFGIEDFESLDADDIENFAIETRKYFGLGLGPISDLTRLLENKGIPVVATDFGDRVGAFSYRSERGDVFFVREHNSSVCRARFSLAHELGHMILHKSASVDFMEDKQLFQLVESQANHFASAFLMPAETFSREFFSTKINALSSLKKRWHVSMRAMIMRAHSLNLITDHQKSYAFTQMAPYGKKEPLDDIIKGEEPSYLKKAIELLEEHSIITKCDLKDRLQLPTTVLAQFFGLNESAFHVKKANIQPFRLKKANT